MGPHRENDLIHLNTILRNTTDAVLCQRSLRIQCKYDTTESSGSISTATQSVISLWLVMKRKLTVSSRYYAPYNLSRCHTIKPPDTYERVSVWNTFIIRNTCIVTFSQRCCWWWWWWYDEDYDGDDDDDDNDHADEDDNGHVGDYFLWKWWRQ